MLRGTGSDVGAPSSNSSKDGSEMEDPEEASLENDVKIEVKEELSGNDEESDSQYFDDILEEDKKNIDDDIHVGKDQKPDLNNICSDDKEQVFGSVPSPNSWGRRSARLKRRTDDFGEFGQVPPPPVKRKVKSNKRLSALIPERCPRQLHCLLCFKTTDENRMKSMPSITEMDFQVMFILKKMLDIPSDTLADYLERFGHPREWITFCNTCIPKVNKAIVIQKEINLLEENLRACQKVLLNTIKKSWNDNQGKPNLSSNNVLRVTIEARNFVLTGKCSSRVRERENSDRRKRRDRRPAKSNSSLARRLRTIKAFKAKRAQCLLEKAAVPYPLTTAEKQTLRNGQKETITNDENEGTQINLNFNLPLPPPVSKPLCSKWKTKMSKWDAKIAKITNKPIINKVRNRHPKELSKHIRTKSELEDISTLNNCKYHCVLCPHVKKMNSHVFISHIQFHSRRPFKCSECQTYFAGRNELELETTNELRKGNNYQGGHKCSSSTVVEMRFKPDKIWECFYCQERFDFDEERDSHQQSAHGENQKNGMLLQRACNICQRKFRSIFEWRLHRVLEHPREAALGCFYCDELHSVKTKEGIDLTDMEKLKVHLYNDHNINGLDLRFVYVCDLCGSNCWSTQILNDHFEKEHKLNKNNSFSCDLCCYRATNRCLLLAHLRNIHYSEEAKIYVCESCGYKVKDGMKYEIHMWSKHGVEPKERPLRKCEELGCEFRTVGKESMDLHMMKEHKAARKHVCKICGKGFTTTGKLKDHEEIHANKTTKPYVCEICGNSFAVKNYLYIHMRLTHQNRPFASTNKKKPSTSRKKTTPKNSSETATIIPSTMTNESPATSLPNVELNSSQDLNINVP